MPFYGIMMCAPHREFTKRMMASRWPFYIAAAIYAILIAVWNPVPWLWQVFTTAALTGGLPKITSFATLFTNFEVTALVWLHLVSLDLFQAR